MKYKLLGINLILSVSLYGALPLDAPPFFITRQLESNIISVPDLPSSAPSASHTFNIQDFQEEKNIRCSKRCMILTCPCWCPIAAAICIIRTPIQCLKQCCWDSPND